MTLQVVYAPNLIFSKHAEKIEKFDDELSNLVSDMFELLRIENAVGIAGNMIGVLKRIVVINLFQDETFHKYALINPEIISLSNELQTFEEASLSFPGISAEITRPKKIKVKYQDVLGKEQFLDAENFLATVIQHEIDYLNGKTFLDHLSKLKKDLLIKKMKKYILFNPPHVHTASCSH